MISASTPKAADPQTCAPTVHKRPLYHWEQQGAHKGVDAVPWSGVPSGWQIIASPRGVRFLPLPKA